MLACVGDINSIFIDQAFFQVITILGRTLEPFMNSGMVPAFGFGDESTKDFGVFPLKPEGYCASFAEVRRLCPIWVVFQPKFISHRYENNMNIESKVVILQARFFDVRTTHDKNGYKVSTFKNTFSKDLSLKPLKIFFLSRCSVSTTK